MQIDRQTIEQAILNFLTAQYNKKTEKEQKQLDKAIADNDVEKVAELNEILRPFKEKYQKQNWLADAKIMAQNVQVGTHISKGIHPSSRGDNVNFTDEVSHDFVNTKTIVSAFVDANSPRGAIDLPLVSFFEWEVVADSGIKMRELILQNSDAVQKSFDDDLDISKSYQQAFLDCLNNQLKNPKSHELNKQTLYPLADDEYRILIPLHPSVLAYEVFLKINQMRFSEENKTARENRTKKTVEQKPYLTFHDLASVQLGGTKPQNVSQLVNKQSGKNYLLPSLPPIFRSSGSISIPKNTKSIFDLKALDYHARFQLQSLFEIIKNTTNNVKIRDARKATLDEIIYKVFEIAIGIKNTRPAGWSKDYPNLKVAQKYWLDPNRGELQDEEEFKQSRELGDWREEIEIAFAEWLQRLLKLEFNKIAHEFGEPEQYEWRDEFKDEIKKSVRLGNGVF